MSLSKLNKRKLLLGTTLVSFSVAAAFPMYAQDNSDEEAVEEVVVTGIRSSIKNALELKREETSIVEAISAEDIGKLPDISIAESLARLPGLTAQRVRGRAQVISVRGLGPEYTTAILNGREQVTAGDNRGVEFDQYPAELLKEVVVYKTPDASLLGQGLAGTADLRTIRPLDHGKQSLSASIRYESNDQGALNAGSNDDGYRFSASYVDQFADNTIGVVLGVTSQSSPTQNERWDAWGYETYNGGIMPSGLKPYVESRDLERNAILGTIEYAPNDKLTLTADAFYSQFEDAGLLRGIEYNLFWTGEPVKVQPGGTIDDGYYTSGVFNNVQGVIRNDARSRDADVSSFALNADYKLNENWTLNADFNTSKVDRDDRDLETYSGTGNGFGNGASDNIGFSVNSDNIVVLEPNLNYADPNTILLTDPQGWGQVGFIKEPSTVDELSAIKLSAERYLGNSILDSVEFGVNVSTREKTKRSEESFIDLADTMATTTAIPSNQLLAPTALEFLGIPGMVSYDPNALLNAGVYTLRPNLNGDVITKAWDVNEDVTTGYVQLNIATTINGSTPLVGNMGIQVVETDQESTGPVFVNGAPILATDGKDYSEVLPSLNLSVEPYENTFFRLSAARTMSRARMDELKISQEASLNNQVCSIDPVTGVATFNDANFDIASQTVCLSGSSGDPRLDPYFATALDFSFEKYFGDGLGNFVFALFHKDLENWILPTNKQIDVTGAATAIFGEAFVNANPNVTVGFFNSPTELNGGKIKGYELATNLSGEMLSDRLAGFGGSISYSYTDSSIKPDASSPAIQVPGLSEDVVNTSLYYERNGFQARVSNRYRSDFLGEVPGFGANLETRDVQAESIFDAQIGYTFQSGALEGSSIILQGYNLTDEEYVTIINDDPRQIKDWQQYGTSYILGFNYKF